VKRLYTNVKIKDLCVSSVKGCG